MNGQNQFGRACEALAERYYQAEGFITVARNFRAKCGELDLVMLRGGLLLFVEVKGRRRDWELSAWKGNWGRKCRRIHQTARVFLASHRGLSCEEIRVDVVFVTQGRVVERFEGM